MREAQVQYHLLQTSSHVQDSSSVILFGSDGHQKLVTWVCISKHSKHRV
jgi:hypothetical protein